MVWLRMVWLRVVRGGEVKGGSVVLETTVGVKVQGCGKI